MRTLTAWVFVALVLAVGCRGTSATPTLSTIGPTTEPTATAVVEAATAVPLSTSTVPPADTTPSPTSKPVSVAILSVVRTVRPGEEFSVDLTLDPQGRGISGVQVQIEYDPAIFQIVEVAPGELLGEKPEDVRSVIPFVDIDNESGVLQFRDARIGPTQPPTPTGRFAAIRFQALDTAPTGEQATLRITGAKFPDENIHEIRDVRIGRELKIEISP